MDSTLTHRQLRFVFEYLQDLNASAAAVRAGYSEKTRASQANELMKNPAVQEMIRVELQGLLSELRCSALELMKERMRAAFFRAETMFSSGWEVLPLEEMAPETRAALQVSTVQRKGGPEVRLRQPDRDKALRALERVHERLDRLNEQYWAKLEREGKVPGLAEIEATDGAGVEELAGDSFEKPQVLSGSVLEAGEAAGGFWEKYNVLSGSQKCADGAAGAFSDKTQVLSGLGVGVGCHMASFDRLRTNGLGSGDADFSSNHQVLSGSRPGIDLRAALFPDKTQVLSGWPGWDGGLPRPQACPWLLRGAAGIAAERELALAA